MKHLGYLLAAYIFAAAVIGAYLLSIRRRHRLLQRRLDEVTGRRVRGTGAPPG